MRVLFTNDGADDAGGVQTYLEAVAGGLAARGHAVALLTHDACQPGGAGWFTVGPWFDTSDQGSAKILTEVAGWKPDIVFSHNMAPLHFERELLNRFPVVKFMHGYFGTCVSGLKMYAFPRPVPCDRRFGPGCLAHYFPRRCGRLSLSACATGYHWAADQNRLFHRYRAVVVASEHMRAEYAANGVPVDRLHINPLFPGVSDVLDPTARAARTSGRVLFLGRMTTLKGGDLLIRAAAEAGVRIARPVTLVMAGDGPQRPDWEALASRLGVPAEFPGWVGPDRRAAELAAADVVAVPSVWPEPFGLTGLEAGVYGVPAVAFDIGGVREWLTDGVNGTLAPADPPTAAGFAGALIRALGDPDRLAGMGRAARATASRMSLAAHLDRLEPVLVAADRAG